MFDSAILDRLSRVHPIVPVLIFLPAIGGLAVSGAPVNQARLDQAMARMNSGQADEEDFLTLSAAAV